MVKLCECGCNNKISSFTKEGKPKRFDQGHYLRFYLKNNRHYNYKGRIKNGGGYIMIWSPNHPNNNNGYMFEHRLIMEKHIGRYLENNEFIHHINGIKDDNRIENMEIVSSSQHTTYHNYIDMSDRKCLFCNSDKTSIDKRKNRPIWSRFENGYLCVKCYRKKYNKTKRYRFIDQSPHINNNN